MILSFSVTLSFTVVLMTSDTLLVLRIQEHFKNISLFIVYHSFTEIKGEGSIFLLFTFYNIVNQVSDRYTNRAGIRLFTLHNSMTVGHYTWELRLIASFQQPHVDVSSFPCLPITCTLFPKSVLSKHL